ncbi:PKD domain-containing protein [Lentzea sp. NPDC054927]
MPSWRSVTIVAVALAGVLLPGAAHAAPPSNDDFDTATVITALPHVVTQDTTESTKASDDPYGCLGTVIRGSAWFTYTATENSLLRLNTEGSDRDMDVTTFTGQRGALTPVQDPFHVGCTTYRAKPITFPAKAGTTYHFMVGNMYSTGGQVKLSLDWIAPLSNDDFANAERVSSLPFSSTEPDFTRASSQPGEPNAGGCFNTNRPSVWYAYTPTQDQPVLMHVNGSNTDIAVYEGTSIGNLTFLACEAPSYYSGKSVGLTAGRTYYFQWSGGGSYSYPDTLQLTETAALQTYVSTGRFEERSIYETIDFNLDHYNRYDDTVTNEWDFGDGTTLPPSTGDSRSHRYTADGVYPVTVHSTTPDGRKSTGTTTVTVKTHDVGITKFTVPASARAGDQKEITVQVANTHYLEKVKTTLYRNNGNGWEEVGTATLDVPAHPTRKVNFSFTYTFTPQDATIGKVSFRAVAEPQLAYPAREARPVDNEVIAIATTVQPAAAGAAVAN